MATATTDQQAYDRLMGTSEAGLAQCRVFAEAPESRNWSARLCDWLGAAVDAEEKRRQFQPASHPPLDLLKYPHDELARALFCSCMWYGAACDGLNEQFLKRLHLAMVGEVIVRLHERGNT